MRHENGMSAMNSVDETRVVSSQVQKKSSNLEIGRRDDSYNRLSVLKIDHLVAYILFEA